jgi:hypothetical protein
MGCERDPREPVSNGGLYFVLILGLAVLAVGCKSGTYLRPNLVNVENVDRDTNLKESYTAFSDGAGREVKKAPTCCGMRAGGNISKRITTGACWTANTPSSQEKGKEKSKGCIATESRGKESSKLVTKSANTLLANL